MKYPAFGKTDVGKKRELNEDSFAVLGEQGVYVVADGMGGHNAGEVASSIAIETVKRFFTSSANDEDMTWPYKIDPTISLEANKLTVGIKFSNRTIYRKQLENKAYSGMGTTIVAMLLLKESGELYIAHVGDSRAYRSYNGTLEQITEDHSLVNEYLKAGQLTPEQAKSFPHKNVIMRALGMKDNVMVEVHKHIVRPGELYFACSDGLTDMTKDEEIRAILRKHHNDSLEVIAAALIKSANDNGGKDNISVVMFKVEE